MCLSIITLPVSDRNIKSREMLNVNILVNKTLPIQCILLTCSGLIMDDNIEVVEALSGVRVCVTGSQSYSEDCHQTIRAFSSWHYSAK